MKSQELLPIEYLEKELGTNWVHLRKARELAFATKELLEQKLDKYSSDDVGIVVFGSLARNEFTEGSDIDWTLLLDGSASAHHLTTKNHVKAIVKTIENKPLGAEGTFGNIAISHDILHKIGGADDTNKNTTQRILLLLESTPIGNREAWSRTINEVLSRYVGEDWGLRNKIDSIPRFLLNDIVRYWRTLCVDFAYKRREREGKGWAIRTIKLRLSRKLIYASGLLSCYSCILNKDLTDKIESATSNGEIKQLVIDHMTIQMRQSPLDIISSIAISNKSLIGATKELIDSYDSFMALQQNLWITEGSGSSPSV
jgi:predicted nucleotidyltransferase